MNKKDNGFTLVELLAVIAVLSIILVIATSSVLKYIEESKEKTKYIAAKEIVEIAEAYFAINIDEGEVEIKSLSDYLESDATNPKTGENDLFSDSEQKICKNSSYSSSSQIGYSNDNGKGYYFDGYFYSLDGNCPQSES